MLPLPKLIELQANLEYTKTLNHSFALRYLQNQPNSSAKNEAAALQGVITALISDKHSDLDSWSNMLKEITSSLSAGNPNPYSDEATQKLFDNIRSFNDEITASHISEKLTAFLTADDYRQISDPKLKDKNGDPVQKDLELVVRLVDDITYFGQIYTVLFSTPALDDLTGKIDEYKDMEKTMILQQKTLMITAPDGIDPERIDDEVSGLEAELMQCNAGVTELAGKRKEYNDKYLDAFARLKNAAEEDRKAINEEVDFYSSEGFRAQMIDKATLVMNAGLKLKQKTRERDMFNTSFATFNSLIDMRNEISESYAAYIGPEDTVAKKVSEQASFFLAESEKNKGTFQKNDAKFTKIQENLRALTNAGEFSNNPDELKKRLDALKAASAEFVEDQKKSILPLNAKTREFRINCAGRIISYCDKTRRSSDNIIWTKTKELDSYVRHIEELPEAAISSTEYSGIVYAQKQLIDKTLEEIDSLKHYIESLLMSEESSSRTGLEVHDAYKKSVFRTVFYLELINELETRSFDSVTEHIYNIDRILSGIRSSLETPDKGVEKMRENPATGYLFIPFDHIESNITYNNYDFFDEFKTTVNIKAALEAHRIDTILNENFHEQLFIDRKIYTDYLEKKKTKH